MPSVVLASASPRRRELLTAAGFAVTVEPADIDERPLEDEAPEAYVERLAREKAAAGQSRHPDAVVIAADTAVVLGDAILGKPANEADARRMLQALSGQAHRVLTGVAVAARGETRSAVEASTVRFRTVSIPEIDAYVATGEPLDKAGAYAIQGGAAVFVTGLDGSHSNVVGLPMERLSQMLESIGLRSFS